jgi:hypothetical protein
MNVAQETSLVPEIIDLIGAGFDKKFAPHLRMANVIIDVTKKRGDCLPKDLLPLGFSQEETTEHWHLAQAMANVELRLMKNQAHFGVRREICHV